MDAARGAATRRTVLMATLAIVGAAATGWTIARRRRLQPVSPSPVASDELAIASGQQLTCETLVLGAGLGGVVAAVRAAELGQRVLLLEAGAALGGTAMYSGGGVHIWGAQSFEEYRRHCPLADPVLAGRLFDTYRPLVDWLLSTGAPGEFSTTTVRGLTLTKYQLGQDIMAPSRIAFFGHMAARLVRLGGRILTGTRGVDLIMEGGRVAGLRAQRDGRALSVRATSVVLASGGFQGNPELLTQYIGPAAPQFMDRGVPTNRGDGLRMALAAGAARTEAMGTLYGHMMPAPPCRPDWSNYNALLLLSAFYAEHGILVNSSGKRFVDEGSGELSGLTINAAAKQPPGELWIVMDESIRRRYAQYELPRESRRVANVIYQGLGILRYLGVRRGESGLALTIDSLRYAQDRGAIVLHDPTLEGLAAQLGARGIDAPGLLATIADYNAHVRDGGTAPGLYVPKDKGAHRIEHGPFHAIKVVVGVSMTYGGVRIDADSQVLDAQGAVMPGLFAVPGAAGGIHRLYFGGALATCAAFGKIAAERIAALNGGRSENA